MNEKASKIYVQIQFIKSKERYCKQLIDKAKEEISFLKESFASTEYYINKMEEPFGIVYCAELKPLLESQYVYVDKYINRIENERKNVYFRLPEEDGDNNEEGIVDKIKKTFRDFMDLANNCSATKQQ